MPAYLPMFLSMRFSCGSLHTQIVTDAPLHKTILGDRLNISQQIACLINPDFLTRLARNCSSLQRRKGLKAAGQTCRLCGSLVGGCLFLAD